MRLDRQMPAAHAGEKHQRPPAPYTAALLEQALRDVVSTVACPAPDGLGSTPVRWGSQIDVQLLDGQQQQVAGYLAKYATKSTEQAGGSVYRLAHGDLDRLALRQHPRRLAQTAFDLHEHNAEVRLARCAHQNGYRGHCLTKSRRYSTTFSALRQAREEWVREQLALAGKPTLRPDERISRYRYRGLGHVTAADAHLAAKAAAQSRQLRRERVVERSGLPKSPRSGLPCVVNETEEQMGARPMADGGRSEGSG
jgi:hypothetical protein